MGILTLIFFANLVLIAWIIFRSASGTNPDNIKSKIGYIKSIGLFAMVIGILGQLIGLFEAFQAIEQMGGVTPEMLAGGIKVSMITTLYGITIYVISFLIWLGLDWSLGQRSVE